MPGASPPSTLINDATARRIVGQAAAFIAATGQQPGRSLVPSELVDYGWHAFILHTVDYADFCHHVPTDEDDQTPDGAAAARQRTMAALEAAGYTVDTELWNSARTATSATPDATTAPRPADSQRHL
ncbi:hypothetical protein ACFYNL_38315 [Streptomyces sp. NPDC007808]|uniref:hypothetical protein n=1 Tax=Streptomyces sp. NPDC007808 TaxID=3364779 RepID=UPI0036B3E38F